MVHMEVNSGTLGCVAVCEVLVRYRFQNTGRPLNSTGEAFQKTHCLIKTQRMSNPRPDDMKEGRVQIKGNSVA